MLNIFCNSLGLLRHFRFLSKMSSPLYSSSVPLLDDTKELCKLTKQGLISRVLQLQDHIASSSGSKSHQTSMKRKVAPARPFSFAKCGKRRVALKFAYLGCDYDGFACQTTTEKTIEHHVLEALKRTRLIPENENCFYSKAGRTDKGVSALEQVISLNIRSNLINVGSSYGESNSDSAAKDNIDRQIVQENGGHLTDTNIALKDFIEPMQTDTDEETSEFNKEMKHVFVDRIPLPDWSEIDENCPIEGEISYLNILNRNTPSDIMFYAWAPVPKDFTARFHCSYRQYKYFFPKCQLDLELMREAASLLVGKNNYQNFCKIDRTRQQMFERSIWEVNIEEVQKNSENDSLTKCCFTVKAEGFLYHQVRYMMSVLFSVGLKQEAPHVVSDLLNLDVIPEKPQYMMASELPLILHETGFPNVKWIHDEDVLVFLLKSGRKMWTDNFTKQSLTETIIEKLTSISNVTSSKDLALEQSGVFSLTHSKGAYVPIKSRQTRKNVAANFSKQNRKRSRSQSKD